MPTTAKSEYRVIGTRPIRHDGVDKVTGRAKYGADVQFTDLLHGKILRSPHAHARIRSIDASKALALPGVKAVVTSADVPDAGDKPAQLGEAVTGRLAHLSSNVLARGKVLYKGHAVAAVAATSPHVAEEAIKLIEVDYEPLPPVLGVLDAMKADAPLLHDDVFTESLGKKSEKPSNIAKHLHFKLGDPEKGFSEADLVIEREFDTATVHQGYIEPHNATAFWNAPSKEGNGVGELTVWTSTQGAFAVRQQVAALLDVPISKVKVVPMEIGGGFGGKISVYLQPVAALLSRKTGRPVKVLMARDEVFEATGPTPASHIRVKIGAKRDGTLTAATAWLAYEAGAFPGSPIAPGCMCIFAPYNIANGQIDGYDVVVNKPKTNAYRAPGATNAAFASETVIDEIAEKLGIDPLQLRIKNAPKEGDRRIDGPVWPRIGCHETVESAMKSSHYSAPLEASGGRQPPDSPQRATTQRREADQPVDTGRSPGLKRGRGVASGFWFNAGLKSSIHASVNPDGTVSLVEGSTDIGGTRASIAMQMAEVLGIPAEDVHPAVVDTDSVGYTDVTGGSRTTFATGHASYAAAQDIQKQMIERASRLWEVPAEEVEADNGSYVCKTDSAKRISFKELAAELDKTGGPVIGRATVNPKGVGGAFSTQIADVEVDPETGKVQVLRYTVVQDAGKAVHPSYVEGQMQGGAVQGIGWALNEEYVYDEAGVMRNASFLDYRMPTTLDLPMIDTIIVEVPNPGHPFGVRGVGEVPIVPPPAAIANAIYAAVGVRLRELPMSPPRLLGAMLENDDAAG